MYNIQCKSLKFSKINKDGLNFCKIYVIINIHELYWFGMRGGMSMAVSGIEHVAVVSFDTAALKDCTWICTAAESYMTTAKVHIFFSSLTEA